MDNIADILSSLSAQDIENLKETAAALFSQGKQEEPQSKNADLFSTLGTDAQMISFAMLPYLIFVLIMLKMAKSIRQKNSPERCPLWL
jgi:hypothetical protein